MEGGSALHIKSAWNAASLPVKLFSKEVAAMNSNKIYEERLAMAHFKFSLIASAIQGVYPDASKAAYYKRICENPLKMPNGCMRTFKPKTVEGWERQYRMGGMDALVRGQRKDKGQTRVLGDECIAEIYRIKEKYPKLNATQIHRTLLKEGFISPKSSVRSVQRFVKEWDLKNPVIAAKERLAFETEYFGAMWQADSCYFPYIEEDGKKRRTYLVMIIDDCSRLIVGAGIYYEDNAFNFQKTLKNAVQTYGIPHKIYVDHGSPYHNNQITLIADSIGALLLHAPVRDGAAKGKIERAFRTVKETWLYGLEVSKIRSLAAFACELGKFVRQYNLTVHSAIGKAPVDRFLETKGKISMPPSSEWLDEAFMNRARRKVKSDSTISIDSVCYDAPMQFIGQTVEIRFLPGGMEAYIYHDKTHFPITKTDKLANSKTKRLLPQIDYTMAGGDDDV
jgi:transposase InsO family protein